MLLAKVRSFEPSCPEGPPALIQWCVAGRRWWNVPNAWGVCWILEKCNEKLYCVSWLYLPMLIRFADFTAESCLQKYILGNYKCLGSFIVLQCYRGGHHCMCSAWVLCPKFPCRLVQEWTTEKCWFCPPPSSQDDQCWPWPRGHDYVWYCLPIFYSPFQQNWWQVANGSHGRLGNWPFPCTCTQGTMFLQICSVLYSWISCHCQGDFGIHVVWFEWHFPHYPDSKISTLCQGIEWPCLWFKSQENAWDGQKYLQTAQGGSRNSGLFWMLLSTTVLCCRSGYCPPLAMWYWACRGHKTNFAQGDGYIQCSSSQFQCWLKYLGHSLIGTIGTGHIRTLGICSIRTIGHQGLAWNWTSDRGKTVCLHCYYCIIVLKIQLD